MEKHEVGKGWDEDLLTELGVEIPHASTIKKAREVGCGEKAPPVHRRFTEWSNAKSFEAEGYVAVVNQITCEECGSMRETFEGVFFAERKVGTGARRLQAMNDRAQWPVHGKHKCEVRYQFTKFCPDCIRQLGFSEEMEAPEKGGFDITIKE